MHLNKNETYIDFKNFNIERLQFIADYIIAKVATVVNPTVTTNSTVKLINGIEINLPLWYLHHQGHTLEEQILKVFPPLNAIKKGKEEVLKIEILNKVADDITEVLSIDILETLQCVQTPE